MIKGKKCVFSKRYRTVILRGRGRRLRGLYTLNHLCPIRGPPAACGPVEGFVLPSLGVCCSKSIVHTGNLPLF